MIPKDLKQGPYQRKSINYAYDVDNDGVDMMMMMVMMCFPEIFLSRIILAEASLD